jgi:hypothetical protein
MTEDKEVPPLPDVQELEEIKRAEAKEAADKFHRKFNILIVTTVVLFAGLFGIAGYVYSLARNINEGICAVRSDSERRISQTKDFLIEHPEGFAGISAAELKRSMENTQRTVNALSEVSCPAP